MLAARRRPLSECSLRPLSGSLEIEAPSRAHLVGAAGSGMRSLADVLLGLGWTVSGSDCAPAEQPGQRPIPFPFFGRHGPDQVPPDARLVVHSGAVPPDNPELCRAAELGIPRMSYFEALGRLMRSRRGLAVAGTHGKSTTSAMLAAILQASGVDPTVCFGAVPLGRSSGGRAGRGPWMVAEACEYRGNFLHLGPEHAAILNVETDHFDCYRDLNEVQAAFARFASLLPPVGRLIVSARCPVALAAAAAARCAVETFGLGPDADWQARGLTARRGMYGFRIVRRGRRVCDVALRVPGLHNVENAVAAAALACAAGVQGDSIGPGLSGFRGLHRRLESRGSWRGAALVDDYAHHPTEVGAALGAIRRTYPGRRVWCVFQPHQVSRTARLLDEMAASLQNADVVAVADIWRAREPAPRPGEVTSADLAAAARARGVNVVAAGCREEILAALVAEARPGDVVVTLGAGDIGKLIDELVERFQEDRAAG